MKRAPKVIYVPEVLQNVLAKKWSFLAVFVVIYFLSFNFFAGVGFAPGAFAYRPAPVEVPAGQLPSTSVVLPEGSGELPERIEIPAVGIEANVSNPNTTDVGALDRELLAGAVRYPGTGVLGEKGNVLMFGHSSHLPVVHNQAYKAFNDIQNLKEGDPIYVFGATKVYVYAVETVKSENTSTGAIPIDASGAKLTLATCDNFGAKSDRFVVSATLVSVQERTDQ